MDMLEGINSRKTYRAFQSKPIPRAVLEEILRASGRSPSYTNTQPWEVAIVTGARRDQLSKILLDLAKAGTPANAELPLPKSWPPALDKRAQEHGARRMRALGVQRDDAEQRAKLRLQNYSFYGAPCALFIFMDRTLTSWSIFDLGLFCENLSLAAHSFGLGSCLQASLAHYPDAVRDFLGISRDKLLAIGVSLGYPDPQAPLNAYQSTRIDLDSYVKWYE